MIFFISFHNDNTLFCINKEIILNAVEFKNITKHFGKFAANDDISFNITENSVHCILGENGAGKSTLMKILFGIYKQDSGRIKVFGEYVKFNSPHDAIDKKIGMVHQHFMLIDDFTVLENVILGNEFAKGIKIDFNKSREILNELIEKYNLDLDVNSKVSEIGINSQQKIEILKLLYRNSEILIFDEPTAVLAPVEVVEFFKIIEEFKKNGKTIILITHKLNEVKEISDKVSVLRRGKLVYEADNSEKKINIHSLSNEIVGETEMNKIGFDRKNFLKSEIALVLKNIYLRKDKKNILENVNLNLCKGEIFGICGVEGNGQNEIIDIIVGLNKSFQGELITDAKNISLVPDDRIKKGMIKEFSIGENILLKSGGKLITKKSAAEVSRRIIDKYDVRVSDLNAELASLSGGNQQKVIFSRELEPDNDILIFSNPTRGVDINASLFIHSKIIEQRNSGKSILLVSSDLDELLNLSDRLGVLYNGKIIKIFESEMLREKDPGNEDPGAFQKSVYDQIGKLMTGITQ